MLEFLRKFIFVVFVGKFFDNFDQIFFRVVENDGRVFDAVKEGGFHHGVVGHVVEEKSVANF